VLTIYGIKNCDTMKKAVAELDTLGVAYHFHDYKKAGIDAAALTAWVAALGLDTVLNRRGTSWRKLEPEQQARADTVDGAIALMQENTSLIKRPVLQGDELLLCGFHSGDYSARLA